MAESKYTPFIIKATKVTGVALIISFILWLCGATNRQILVSLVMMVLAFSATYSGEKKHIRHVFYSTLIIALSIIVGGFVGFYMPLITPWLVMIYAVLAFLIPKTKYYAIAFVLGSLMFLVFTSMPFSWAEGWRYILCALFVIFGLCFSFWVFHLKTFLNEYDFVMTKKEDRQMSALTVGIAMVLAWICFVVLERYTKLEHLYWIGLTVLTVALASQQGFIRVAFLRIIANILAVLFIVVLMDFIVPEELWVEFLLLFVLFFLIFATGFSYVLRVMFIAMFVLTFMTIGEEYTTELAVDRVYFTLIGSGLVLLSYCISCFVLARKKQGAE
jgi:MFS family permease